jgi:peroxiredoxin
MFHRAASLLILTSVSLFFFAACAPSREAENSPSNSTEADAQGQHSSVPPLPDFELSTLDGGRVALSDHLGKDVILIDFWATYCAPCILAMPHLNRVYEKYKDQGFVILGVSVDGPESQGRVRAAVKKMRVTFPILLDEETEALALYNPNSSAPYSVLIDRRGRILKSKEGLDLANMEAFEQEIARAIESKD